MVRLSVEAVNDPRLTYRARGLLAFLLTYDDDEQPPISDLHMHATEGREAVATALRELIDVGYVWRYRGQRHDGTWEYKYVLFEDPPLLAGAIETKSKQSTSGTRQRSLTPNERACTVCKTINTPRERTGLQTYILRRGRVTKIGTTANLTQRVRQLSRPVPGVIVPDEFDGSSASELLAVTRYPEHSLHKVWQDMHLGGEWFESDPLLIEWATGLPAPDRTTAN